MIESRGPHGNSTKKWCTSSSSRRLSPVFSAVSAVLCFNLFSITSASADPYWSNAIEVPGLSLLNATDASPGPIVCTSSGNCVSGGQFNDAQGHVQAFLSEETDGVWSSAQTVAAALNVGGVADITAISCPTAGNCTATGAYGDSGFSEHSFVINQVNGTWGFATEIPDFTTLHAYDVDLMATMYCASATSCVGLGSYFDSSAETSQPLIFTETDGEWAKPVEAPGFTSFNPSGSAGVELLSCTSITSCVAGGVVLTVSPTVTASAFLIDENSGVWSTPVTIPGLAGLSSEDVTEVEALSCAAPGECSLGGDYLDKVGDSQAFVANEVGGVWGNATQLFGNQLLGSGLVSNFTGISCPAAGDCSAVGTYSDADGLTQPYVVTESNHTWSPAYEAPGVAGLNSNAGATLSAISCSAVGDCSAGGSFQATLGSVEQAFLINEANGTWTNAIEVPGSASLNSGGTATASAVSCSDDGSCGVEGTYTDAKSNTHIFFVNSSLVAPTTVSSAPRHVTATETKGVVTVRWSPPANNGGTAITDYTVVSVPAAKSCITRTTFCSLKGLNKKVHYSFEVRATNADGKSAFSARSNVLTNG